ncbi:MAG: ImmA/IrrE family metallo-endopeptidase [Eubacteriales bacterium]|nr:ImmA/IrrE family metallo-endopeptidase [Eubacteriales bacterium]
MTCNVIEAVNKARDVFGIKDFPGNFFALLEKQNYTEKYRLLLFKEDIDKLSGFIGYGDNEICVICINYQRPIGHQNFTLAHELGHWFMHKGQNISDDDKTCSYSTEKIEQEANDFAAELLYPERLFKEDFSDIIGKDLLRPDSRKALAIYIDKLCHKYCLSFDMVFRKILYKNRQIKQYSIVKREIEKALGCKISEYFEKDFYVPNEELPEYQQLRTPYIDLEKKVDRLVALGKIGEATAEAIKYRNGIQIN